MTKTIRYLVFGRVQGVAFRAFVRDKAHELGIQGWASNRADGSVECLVEAGHEKLDEFESALSTGPRWGRVDRVEKQDIDEEIVLSVKFEIR